MSPECKFLRCTPSTFTKRVFSCWKGTVFNKCAEMRSAWCAPQISVRRFCDNLDFHRADNSKYMVSTVHPCAYFHTRVLHLCLTELRRVAICVVYTTQIARIWQLERPALARAQAIYLVYTMQSSSCRYCVALPRQSMRRTPLE